VSAPQPAARPRCRFCGAALAQTFVDLGMSPLCESYVSRSQLNQMEPFYPLHVFVCQDCFLVQLEAFVAPEHIFSEYAYFSSYSDSWLEHARCYVERMVARFGLDVDDQVVEVGSNDGYLLRNFVARGIPALGVEPAANVAQAAIRQGVPTRIEFFGRASARQMAAESRQADLLVGNNVLAQVPDLNDFVAGLKLLLKPNGVITMEFPHLLRLMQANQFDTIYHEHFSYFSWLTVERIFAAHGLRLFDVEELATHGGSLRIYAGHVEDVVHPVSRAVAALRAREEAAGLARPETYAGFGKQVEAVKWKLLEFLIQVRRSGKVAAGYGAPGNGNTLLNYCGIRTDLLDYTVDRNTYKQGKFLPGTHVPIYPPERLAETRPDYVLILPWNLKDEIMGQLAFIRQWGGRFVVPIPEVNVYP